MAPRTVRMLALLELDVRPTWSSEYIEQTVRLMMEALRSDQPANIRIARYQIHTLQNAYARLLEVP